MSGVNSTAPQGGPGAADAASGLMSYEESPGCPSGAARPSVYISAQRQVRRIRPAKHYVNQIIHRTRNPLCGRLSLQQTDCGGKSRVRLEATGVYGPPGRRSGGVAAGAWEAETRVINPLTDPCHSDILSPVAMQSIKIPHGGIYAHIHLLPKLDGPRR